MEAEVLARDFISVFKEAGCKSVEYVAFALNPTGGSSYGAAYFDPAGPNGKFARVMVGVFGPRGLLADPPVSDKLTPKPTIVIWLRPIEAFLLSDPIKSGLQ